MLEASNLVVVFDLDDTLYPERSYVKSGVSSVSSLINALTGLNVEHQLLEYHESDGDDFIGEACRLANLPYSAKEGLLWHYRLHFPSISLDAETKSLLEDLRSSGVALAILTDGRGITQRMKIKALGLDWIRSYISEDFGSEKPDPLRFTQIMHDFPGSTYVYIADNPRKDFQAPEQLGWRTFQLEWKPHFVHNSGKAIEYSAITHYRIDMLSDFRRFLTGLK
jgi:putative hydrolase of the HAD superfamily